MLIKNTRAVPPFIAGDKTVIRELLHPKNETVDINYSVAHASVLVGEASLPHSLNSSEVYYILQGRGEVYIDDASKPVQVGDIVFIPPKATQYIKNTGTEVLSFLCIVEPFWTADSEHIND